MNTYTWVYSDDFEMTFDNLSIEDCEALLHSDITISKSQPTDIIMILINGVVVYDFHEDYDIIEVEEYVEHEEQLTFQSFEFESVAKLFEYNTRIKHKDVHYIFK